MSTSDGAPVVLDEPTEHRFVVRDGNNVAELVYERDPGHLRLVHTGVPEAMGGRGIAGRLVQSAVDRAAEEGLIVVPICPYARRWLSDHTDAAATVAIEWPQEPPQA